MKIFFQRKSLSLLLFRPAAAVVILHPQQPHPHHTNTNSQNIRPAHTSSIYNLLIERVVPTNTNAIP